MFERFSGPAREVVLRARTQAQQLRSPLVGTEHLLLAMLDEDAGLAYEVLRDAGLSAGPVRERVRQLVPPPLFGEQDVAALRSVGIDLDQVIARIEESFGPDALEPPATRQGRGRWRRGRHPDGTCGHQPGGRFGPRAKKVLELSLREAIRMRHGSIGAEHILLGLIREGDGLAAKILTESGAQLPALRRAIEDRLREAA